MPKAAMTKACIEPKLKQEVEEIYTSITSNPAILKLWRATLLEMKI